MVGRLLGGIATSILYSAFESWVIFEHNKVSYSLFASGVAVSAKNVQNRQLSGALWRLIPEFVSNCQRHLGLVWRTQTCHVVLNLSQEQQEYKLQVLIDTTFVHSQRNFDGDLLGTIFSHAVLGNSIVAITAGIVAQQFADTFGFV